MSVHSALTTHRKNHRRRKVLGKWSLTGMAAVMSCVLSFQAIEGDELKLVRDGNRLVSDGRLCGGGGHHVAAIAAR